MEYVLITGGTGLVGSAITSFLTANNFKVIILTRNKSRLKPSLNLEYAEWDVEKRTIDKRVFEKASYIIHLAGENVAGKRWTKKRKNAIVRSRVESTSFLCECLKQYNNKVKAILCASAIGWYGPDPEIPNPNPFKEFSSCATDFLGQTCQQWEKAIAEFRELNKRVVILRTGIVLSNDGGAYVEFRKCVGPGVTVVLGKGNQIVSWIHIDDLVAIYYEAITNDHWQRIYNAVAPNPVSNEQLILAIEKAKNKNQFTFHIPSFILKLALGEMSIEVLKSCTVSSLKVQENGYNYKYPTIGLAIENLRK
jgi:uncharacterized protein (TIGR01777 family)